MNHDDNTILLAAKTLKVYCTRGKSNNYKCSSKCIFMHVVDLEKGEAYCALSDSYPAYWGIDDLTRGAE